MTPPLFSIVIPTYNRSELVQGAVRSILAQTFDDFEVVVSDNCSQDDTRAVIAGIPGPPGPVCPHARSRRDRRELGVRPIAGPGHARHDAVRRRCAGAERAGAVRRRAPASRRRLPLLQSRRIPRPVLSRTTAEYGELSAVHRRRARWCPPTNSCGRCSPSGRNSTCTRARSCLRHRWPIEWCSGAGRFFRTNGVEYFAWPLAAVFSSSIVHIDLPLVILGRTAKSWGSTIVLSNPGKQQIQKMIADVAQTRDWIPLTNFTLCNLMAEGMLLALQMFPDELRQFPFDEQQYLRSTMKELRRRQAMGVDVCPEMTELQTYAKKYPPLQAELAAPAKNGLLAHDSAVRKLARTVGLNLIYRRLHARKQARKINRGDVKSGFHAAGR